ncbi:MAG: dihydropteroate synthase [Candidatus Binatia bacterium]|jgi:dihydropteroate synthase
MLTLKHLAEIYHAHPDAAAATVREFSIGDRGFRFNSEPAIMGVVNLSPDSWYRESVCLSVESAIRRGQTLAAQGAHIVDLGAESTLADAARLDDTGQKSKLLPVLKGLRERDILVSIETYQPAVTKACLEAGANVLNLTGTASAEEMYRMAAANDAAVIICHVQGDNVREAKDVLFGDDAIADLRDYFSRQIETATRAGVTKIFIDPGLGFYYRNLTDGETRVRHQIDVFLNSFRLRELGFPVCHALPHAFETFGEEVRSAEPFFAVLAALGRTDLFRTHEVAKIKATLDTMQIVNPAELNVT